MPDRKAREPGRDTKPSGPPTTQPISRASAPQPEARVSWLGLPGFHWSLTLFGLCVFTFAIVTFRLPVGDVGIAIAAAGLFFQLGKLRMPFPVWLYAAFVLWALVASFFAPYKDVAIDQVIERAKLLLVMVIAVNALQTEGQLRFYLLFFLGCFVLFPVRGALMAYAGGYTRFGRALWNYIYANNNDLATLSLLALGVAVGLTFSEGSRNFVRFGAGLSAILLLVVILLTQSRGAFIGLVAGMGPPIIRLGIKRPALVVPAVLVALAIGFAVPASVWERLGGIEKLTSASTIADADPEGSAAERFQIQKVGWQIFMDHPVFGIGLGAYPQANAMYAPDIGKKDTHNTYLNLAAELGLPGLVLWLACFGSVLRYAYRSRRQAAPGVLATQQAWIERAFLAYLVASIVGTYAKLSLTYLMLTVLWCSATLLASSPPPARASTRTASL